MPTSAPRSWLRISLVVALVYVIVGLVTIALARVAPGRGLLFAIRLASWTVSAIVFVVHIAHESRFRAPAATTAVHAAAAVAIATETLALIATLRLALAGSVRPAMIAALVVWPLLTGVVSFLVAWALAIILGRVYASAPDMAA
ncbi:MAG TPA: hypothetical protein VJ992_00960 [Gemmatimonadales bacterium]|nr:hypothetical protein [Gemmatimonadales bacterium]